MTSRDQSVTPVHGDIWQRVGTKSRLVVLSVCGHHDPPCVSGYWLSEHDGSPTCHFATYPLPRFLFAFELEERSLTPPRSTDNDPQTLSDQCTCSRPPEGMIGYLRNPLCAVHSDGDADTRYLSREEATNVIRGIFRRCGYAVAEHGTRGRDLDLIAVPWTDRAGVPALIVEEVVEALGGTVLRAAEPGEKPHGRLVWTIVPGGRRPHDLWYVDLGVIEPRTDI